MSERKNNTGRTVAVVGGAALLALLLFRGKGWGLGGSGSGSGGGGGAGGETSCRVRIDADGVELDGLPADLPTTVERCKAAGRADVTATGAAIVGVIAETVRSLKDAGVDVYADPAIWDTVGSAPSRAK